VVDRLALKPKRCSRWLTANFANRTEEERGECPFCGERAVVGPAGARICLACDTPVHSAADEEE
jgi:hypothetical protein